MNENDEKQDSQNVFHKPIEINIKVCFKSQVHNFCFNIDSVNTV